MARVFISYRSDDAYAAALLDHVLSTIFGREEIFRASRSIRPGQSYPDELVRALKDCAVVIVLIGPGWVDRTDGAGDRLLDREHDWVRQEIVTALGNRRRVIPVLLRNADKLVDSQLPASLVELAGLQFMPFDVKYVDEDALSIARELLLHIPLPKGAQPVTVERLGPNGHRHSLVYERGQDLLEIELSSRGASGRRTSRLSGRVDVGDLPAVAGLLMSAAEQVGRRRAVSSAPTGTGAPATPDPER